MLRNQGSLRILSAQQFATYPSARDDTCAGQKPWEESPNMQNAGGAIGRDRVGWQDKILLRLDGRGNGYGPNLAVTQADRRCMIDLFVTSHVLRRDGED